jgi:DNA-binding NarL/FixJ family response regulator
MTRVLIVDDQPVFRKHLGKLLGLAGLEVVAEAGDVPQAEQQIPSAHPDLAVVDVLLPGVSGLEGVARLKAIDPAIRIILISAYADQFEVFRHAAQRMGAEAFFAKDDLDLSLVSAW